jgi:hypothetical protein
VPRDLATLLLEDGAVSAEALARAQERQREAGGALDTALLEEGVIDEQVLLDHLARASDLPAAPEGAWSGTDGRARRVFPSRVAERHGLAPFALEGRELSLVATYPVDVELLDEISFMLSLHLTAHVGPEWRVRELIHRLYGSPLAPRLAALAAAAGAPWGAPHAETVPPERAPPAEPPPPPAPLSGFARDTSEPLEPLAAALEQALESVDLSFREEEDEGEEGGAGEAEEAPPPADRSAPPRWGLEDARGVLAAARHRDEVVLSALRYARDFFEYAAVFAVTRDAVAGHDALGAEDERDRARSVAIYAADPGIFKTVIETRSPYLGPGSRDAPGNAAILEGLGRGIPRTVLVYPVLLRDRPVCILYADNGEAPVSARRLGDLLLFLSTVGAAFERIIRDRKRRPRRPARVTVPAEAELPPVEVTEAPAGEPELAEIPPLDLAAGVSAPDVGPAPPPRSPPPAESLGGLEEQFSFGAAEHIPGAEAAAPPAPPPRSAAPPATPAPAPPEPPSLPALADRALDADAAVSAAACESLAEHRRDPAVRQANEKLRRALLSGISGRATRAARALGAIRDVEAIPLLIQVLETSEPETANAAADALAGITLQRLGPDARKWLGWWKQNRGRGRAEWLFSGLTSPDRETRVAASTELALAAPPPVPYSADAPAKERERLARAWAGWWARSGHVL